MSTWAWPLPPAEFHTRVFPWRMMHAPLIGPYLLGRHNALAGRGIYLSVVDREKFRTEAQPAYEAVLPDPATRLLTWTGRAGYPSIRRRAPRRDFAGSNRS
jgi:haloalkane dehalogenase